MVRILAPKRELVLIIRVLLAGSFLAGRRWTHS